MRPIGVGKATRQVHDRGEARHHDQSEGSPAQATEWDTDYWGKPLTLTPADLLHCRSIGSSNGDV